MEFESVTSGKHLMLSLLNCQETELEHLLRPLAELVS